MMQKIMGILVDLMIAAVIVAGVWLIGYKLPQQGMMKVQDSTNGTWSLNGASNAFHAKDVQAAGMDLKSRFKEHFSDTVISTDTMYKSPDLSVELSFHQVESGMLDDTGKGDHKAYGTQIYYTIADVYVADIRCLQTAFAQDTYGVGYDEKLTDMSARLQSVLAINGDSYSNNRHQDNGTIIRNGKVYRSKQSDAETCVLNMDGSMDIYAPGTVDSKVLRKKGAYQSWVFGPSLLDADGMAKKSFITWDYIRQSHPRTAIGYYEPGHYCFLLADGRQKTSRGMFLEEMAKVFEQLGCKKAYNLDGGHCSFMTKGKAVVNHPYKKEHKVSDGIFLREVTQ